MNKITINKRLEDINHILDHLKMNKGLVEFTNAMVALPKKSLKQGISIIIPTYKGEQFILTCLTSLAKQSLLEELFEIIIVINGEKDGTMQKVEAFSRNYGMANIRIEYTAIANAANARNIGLKKAQRQLTLFLDDDDYLSPNYLEDMLNCFEEDTIIVSQIVDVTSDGIENYENTINQQIMKAVGNEGYVNLSGVITMNACKLIPTEWTKLIKFKDDLASGEDVVYFSELLTRFDAKFKVVPISQNCIYYRLLRDNSISRKELSFEFNVTERLQVVKALNAILVKGGTTATITTFIKQKISAQLGFVNRYIKEKPKHRQLILENIKQMKLSFMPYYNLNQNLAEKLVISYCFPPFADTSGNVMAKRIREDNQVVDVVYNQMNKVREQDGTLNHIVDDLIDTRLMINSPTSFSNWQAIAQFVELGMERIDANKSYKEVYSRAMWPASHFLAYEYKMKHPEIKWVAEFSDPIILDVEGKERFGEITDPQFMSRANKSIPRKFKVRKIVSNNLFFWCELLPYIFADEIVFTNEHQLKYMLDNFPIKHLKGMIKSKAVIKAQNTLPAEFYYQQQKLYTVDNKKINLAYFGNFYKTRNMNDIFEGLKMLSSEEMNRINIHIFTSNPSDLIDQIKDEVFYDCIKINPYVSYLEFLNLTTRFDCLIINDADTKPYKAINPYLPSKLSDYLGSGNAIWAIYERDSVLSEIPVKYKSELHSYYETSTVYKQLIADQNKKLSEDLK